MSTVSPLLRKVADDRQIDGSGAMTMTELDPDVADDTPLTETSRPRTRQHFVTYLRLLDADAEGADWHEVARIVLHRDPVRRTGAQPALLGGAFAPGQMDDRAWLPPPAGWPVSDANALSSVTYVLPGANFEPASRESKTPAKCLTLAALILVAGTGFEPVTFRL